ncbi:hypothetical protein WA158_004937 [Blastocystis sp. Blastoise]
MKIGSQESPAQLAISTLIGSTIVQSKTCFGCNYASSYPYDMNNSTTVLPISCDSYECQSNTCGRRDCDGTCQPSTHACCAKSDKSICGFGLEFMSNIEVYGSVIRDNIMFQTTTGWSTPYPTTIGYIDRIVGTYKEKDGLLGLAYKSKGCDPSCFNTYFDDMVDTISGMNNIFTMCFGNNDGILTYGGIDKDLYYGNITWINLIGDGFYSVEFNDIRVNNISMFHSIETRYAYFNTMDFAISLQSDLYQSIVEYLKTNYCHLPSICGKQTIFENYCLTSPPSSDWPSIDIYLNGIPISLSPDLYFIPLPDKDNTIYCFAINKLTSGEDVNTFGSSLMRGFTFVFDKEQDRIGIATPSSSCHATSLGGINRLFITSLPDKHFLNNYIIIYCITLAIILQYRSYHNKVQFVNEKSINNNSLDLSSQSLTNQKHSTI